MIYRIVVRGYDSGINELLHAQVHRYNPRTKKTVVANSEKKKNDKICRLGIMQSGHKNLRIDKPIFVHYHFYCKDKKHDKTNLAYGFCKSFLDALQEMKVIKNDGWNEIYNVDFSFHIDKGNPRVEIELEEMEADSND